MNINPILRNVLNYLMAAMVIAGMFILIDFVYDLKNQSFLTMSDAEERPDLPTKIIKTIEWKQGMVADVCNSQVMTIPYLIIEKTDTIEIEGWAVDIDNKTPLSELYMEVNENYFPAYFDVVRDDVANLLSLDLGNQIGFSFLFDRNILKNSQGEWASNINLYGVTADGDSLLSPVEYKLLTVVDEPTEPYKQYANVQFVVDVLSAGVVDGVNKTLLMRNEPSISILGWSFEGILPLSDLYVVINDKAFRMNYGVEREDVKNVFGFMNSNKLGYSFDFPRSLLMKEDGTYADYIDFVPIDASGYVCNRVRYSIIYQ